MCAVRLAERTNDGPFVAIGHRLKINGKAMQGLCDSGATRSVISADLVKRLQLKVTKSQLANPFIPANGHPIFPVGQVSLNVNIQGLTIPSTLYVVNNLHPKLIL